LRRLFTRLHRAFGAAVLIDCHSMPSTAGAKDERPRADIVLGDRYGTSCVPAVVETIETTLRGRGYVVSRNKPYAGGFITEHYGNPAVGLHAIQLELNRALYMDERRYERAASFQRVAADLEILAEEVGAIPEQELRPYRAAAE
jgi:N-formylglutamate deformylase